MHINTSCLEAQVARDNWKSSFYSGGFQFCAFSLTFWSREEYVYLGTYKENTSNVLQTHDMHVLILLSHFNSFYRIVTKALTIKTRHDPIDLFIE